MLEHILKQSINKDFRDVKEGRANMDLSDHVMLT